MIEENKEERLEIMINYRYTALYFHLMQYLTFLGMQGHKIKAESSLRNNVMYFLLSHI